MGARCRALAQALPLQAGARRFLAWGSSATALCSWGTASDRELKALPGSAGLSGTAGVLPPGKPIPFPTALVSTLVVLKVRLGSQALLASVLFPSQGADTKLVFWWEAGEL